jgi:hypothetical protein
MAYDAGGRLWRMFSRAGVMANWDAVFAAAEQRDVAIEIDGDPARQDLDHTPARALEAGCSSRSTAMRTAPISFHMPTAMADTRLVGIPVDGIVNCWRDRLLVAVESHVRASSVTSTTATRPVRGC